MAMSDDVRIIHADCRDVLPTLADASFDAIITDPPYGTGDGDRGYGRGEYSRLPGRIILGDCDLSVVAGILAEAGRLLKPDAWLALFCSPKRRFEVEHLCRDAGFVPTAEVVWDKGKGTALGGKIRWQHETVLLCPRGSAVGYSSLFSVLPAGHGFNGNPRHHIHEKALVQMRELVEFCCPRDGLALDPCAGSGSVPVACMKSGRRCIAVEIDPRYIPVIGRRVRDAETPLFDALTGREAGR